VTLVFCDPCLHVLAYGVCPPRNRGNVARFKIMDKKAKRRLGDQPKAVIQRWWRLKFNKLGRRLGRAYMRRRLPRTERKVRAAREAAFETIKYWAIKNENGKFKGLSTLYNIALYLLIADRDIQAVKIDALTHPDEWTRKLIPTLRLIDRRVPTRAARWT
jgi:hypothetical protein